MTELEYGVLTMQSRALAEAWGLLWDEFSRIDSSRVDGMHAALAALAEVNATFAKLAYDEAKARAENGWRTTRHHEYIIMQRHTDEDGDACDLRLAKQMHDDAQ